MPRQDGPEESGQRRSTTWKAKLKPGAVQLLAGVSENFQSLWEHYREAIPRDEVEEANLKDLEWDNYYRDLRADAGIIEPFLNQELFVQTAQAAIDELAKDRNELLLLVLATQHAVLFHMNGLKHPEDLLKNIRDGDDQALFDFAKVDKTIISHRYVRERIRMAQISGDSEFFKKLGSALKWDPRNRPLKVNKRNFLLKIIALCATEHLTMNEVCDILDHVCGIFEEDIETVRKAWTRAGLHELLPEKEKES